MQDVQELNTIPVGPLGIIPVEGCREFGKKVDEYLVAWRRERGNSAAASIIFSEYQKDSYILKNEEPRFGTGEGKGVIAHSVRGDDIFILVDVCNYSITCSISGQLHYLSPDDHFQNLKRVIAAIGGKARRITVIMPFLYESRRDKRDKRESLDCAMALHELCNMGVDHIVTFDAHEPRIQNAIPLKGFENVRPIYQFIKNLLLNVPDIQPDSKHMMILSPDEGGMARAIHFANVLGLDVGMFYRRRDYTTQVNGQNPVISNEFLGASVEDKDVVIIDDMISSGETVIEMAKEMKKRKARRVFICATFGIFTAGLEKFDKAYEEGIIDRVLTTNLIYQTPELLSKPYYINADMTKYVALLIDSMNHDVSLTPLLKPEDRIQSFLKRFNAGEFKK